MRFLILAIVLSIPLAGCFENFYLPPVKQTDLGNNTSKDWRADYSKLLEKYVHPTDGLVDYPGLFKEKAILDSILLALKTVDTEGFDDNQKLAFWINAYNIAMIWNILDTMATEGEDIFNTKKVIDYEQLYFKTDRFTIAGKKLSLNEMEYGVLRLDKTYTSKFKESDLVKVVRPEIHAAVSCAALSCPPLRNKIWNADTVDQELRDAFKAVMNDTNFATLDSSGKPKVSRIIDWFFVDFKFQGQTVGAYLSTLVEDSKLKAALEAAGDDKEKFIFNEYDWNLNLWKK